MRKMDCPRCGGWTFLERGPGQELSTVCVNCGWMRDILPCLGASPERPPQLDATFEVHREMPLVEIAVGRPSPSGHAPLLHEQTPTSLPKIVWDGEGEMETLMEGFDPSEQLLSLQEVAEFFQVHPNTVRRWVHQGLLPSYRVGPQRLHRFRFHDLDAFLTQQEEDSLRSHEDLTPEPLLTEG